MKKIAITGNYMSGLDKASEVCQMLDIPVFQADLALKFLLNWREDILKQIRIQFGYNVFRNGSVDPEKFKGTDRFDRLVDVAEVDLLLLWESFCVKHSDKVMVAYSSHIVHERDLAQKISGSALNGYFDAVVNVYRPQSWRVADVCKSKSLTHADALTLLSQEMPEDEKSRKSDYVIHNYDSLSMLTQMEAVRTQVLTGLPASSVY
jgi:dephospho-CoA kinase